MDPFKGHWICEEKPRIFVTLCEYKTNEAQSDYVFGASLSYTVTNAGKEANNKGG